MIFHNHALNRDDRYAHARVFCHEMMNDPPHDKIVPVLQMIMERLRQEIAR